MLFAVAQLNFGNDKHQAKPEKVLEVMRNHRVALLSGCELGGKVGDRLTHQMTVETPYSVIQVDLPDHKRTRTFYDPSQVKLNHKVWFKLSDSKNLGPGAGPTVVEPKFFVGGDFDLVLTNRNMRFGAEHLVASQWNPMRSRFAKQQVHTTIQKLDTHKDLLLMGMDGNNKWKSSTFNEFRRNEFTSDVAELGTFGKKWKHNIDFIVYREAHKRLRPVGHYQADVGSDHPMHVAVFDITWKKRKHG